MLKHPARYALLLLPLALGACAQEREDPGIAWARGGRPLVRDKVIIQQQRDYREAQAFQGSRQLNAAEEGKIPYAEIHRYPPNWPEISERRDRAQ